MILPDGEPFEHVAAGRKAAVEVCLFEREALVEDAAVRRVFDPHIDLDLGRPVGGQRAGEGHGGCVELDPIDQRSAVGHPRAGGEVRRKPLAVDHAEDAGALEEQHVAIGFDIVAEGFGGDHELRAVFEARHEVVAQDCRFVARHDGDADPGGVVSASTVADRVFEPGGTVEVGARRKFDHAIVVETDLAVGGEARNAVDDQHVAVLVAVIGEQAGRINDQQLVFERAQAVIVTRDRRVVVRLDEQLVLERCGCAALVDHLVFDEGRAERIGGEQEVAGRLVDRDRAVRGGIFVRAREQADEADRIAFDIVAVGQQVGDGDALRVAEPDLVDRILRTRRVVDR